MNTKVLTINWPRNINTELVLQLDHIVHFGSLCKSVNTEITQSEILKFGDQLVTKTAAKVMHIQMANKPQTFQANQLSSTIISNMI